MTGPQRQRWPRWWPVLPLALVGLLVVIVVAQKPSAPLSVVPEPTSRTSVPSSTTASPTTASATTSTPASSGDEPPRRSVGRPILGITAGWDLFVAGEHAVMRIHPATGSIVTTAQPKAAPPLAGATWIGVDRTSVVVGAEGLAGVGYLVADDRPAVPLPIGLATVQQLWPGPAPGLWWATGQDWRPTGDPPWVARVVQPDLGPTERTARLPSEEMDGVWTGDGAGGLLYLTANRIYQLSSGAPLLLHSGTVVAVGAGKLLIDDCDERLRCGMGVFDVRSWSWTPVPAVADLSDRWIAALSGDGRLAVAVSSRVDLVDRPLLIDLRTGHTMRLAKPINLSGPNAIVFSPDDSWLFAIDSGWKLVAFDTATGTDHPLELGLPPVSAVAVRPEAA